MRAQDFFERENLPELAAAIAKFFGKAADGAALREMDEEDMAELAEDHLEPLAVRPLLGFGRRTVLGILRFCWFSGAQGFSAVGSAYEDAVRTLKAG